MDKKKYVVISDLDGSNARKYEVIEGPQAGWKIVKEGEQLIEPFPSFGGSMGETRPRSIDGIYFGSGIDTSDGTVRLSPSVTTAVSLDIAYCPLTFWEDFDADGDRAVYIFYRDTTTTPDMVIKKIRITDNAVIDTETSTDTAKHIDGTTDHTGAAAAFTAPRICSTAVFLGKTYVASGDQSGNNTMRKVHTVGDISAGTADTYRWADDSNWAYSLAVIQDGDTTKFVRGVNSTVYTATAEPCTLANFDGGHQITTDGVSPIVWMVGRGDELFVYKTENLYSWAAGGQSKALLPVTRDATTKAYTTYDDFDGHMGGVAGDAVFYPGRIGFWRYRKGRAKNLSVDSIPGYRAVPNISNIPIGLRHYGMASVGNHVYAVYKPTGFGNSVAHILYGYYDPDSSREITWRPFITRSADIVGPFIDSGRRLWWVEKPRDPTLAAGTVTFDAASSGTGTGTLATWSHTFADTTTAIIGVSNYVSSGTATAPSGVWVSTILNDFLFSKIGEKVSGQHCVSLWRCNDVPGGARTINVQFDTTQANIVGGCTSWTGVDTSNPIRGYATASGSNNAVTVAVTSATNDVVVDCVGAGSSVTATVGAGQTSRWNATSSPLRGLGSNEAGAASVTMSWALSASATWVTIGASLQPSGAGTANADLNYVQLADDGSPNTVLGANRGAVSTDYYLYGQERDSGLPHTRKQATAIKFNAERIPSTVSIQPFIHRDSGTQDDIGTAVSTSGVSQVVTTPGTSDTYYRVRLGFKIVTDSSYAPTTSDPRLLDAELISRTADVIRGILLCGSSHDSAQSDRRELMQRKDRGTVLIKQEWDGVSFRADVTGVRDVDDQVVELYAERFEVESG